MKVTDRVRESGGAPVFICDFSPPRGAGPEYLEPAGFLEADYICVAYSPGKAVRVDSMAMAYSLKRAGCRDVVFVVATRDMNKLAIQNHLLGAQMLGLENVVIIGGDPFNERDLSLASHVADFTPTRLMRAIAAMNEGTDYKGSTLRVATDFCVGASIDLGRGLEQEARLTRRKADSGAHFFLTQPIFGPEEADRLLEAYRTLTGADLAQPVFWGVQVLEKDGVIFSNVPKEVQRELEEGRPAVEMAVGLLHRLIAHGINTFYLMPPIRRSGARNYRAAQEVIAASRAPVGGR